MKLKNIVSEYLESIKYGIKQKTYLFYLQLTSTYIAKFNEEISTKNLVEFIAKIKENYSFSTTKLVKSLINRSLNFAFENGILGTKICIKFDLKNKIIYIDKSVGIISHNHKTLIIESSPKTQSSIREIPISKQLQILLKTLKQNSKNGYVITSYNNKQLSPRAYQKSFENLLKKLHIKHYGFHSLRHTFATRLLENGIDIKTISELLGHSSPTITLNRYVHTNLQNKHKAMEKIAANLAKK